MQPGDEYSTVVSVSTTSNGGGRRLHTPLCIRAGRIGRPEPVNRETPSAPRMRRKTSRDRTRSTRSCVLGVTMTDACTQSSGSSMKSSMRDPGANMEVAAARARPVNGCTCSSTNTSSGTPVRCPSRRASMSAHD